MSVEDIKKMLETGKCPYCDATVQMDESEMTVYKCGSNPNHFTLEVDFGPDGNTLNAKLNDKPLPENELQQITW